MYGFQGDQIEHFSSIKQLFANVGQFKKKIQKAAQILGYFIPR
jgi:hypothetical protein